MTARNVSTYKPEYCEAVREHCARGGSIETFGPTIGKVKQTIYTWQKQYPEFAEACELAKGVRAAQIEYALAEIIDQGDKGKRLGAIIYALGNYLPDVWRNVQRTELTGKDGGPVDGAVTVTFVRPALPAPKADDGA